MPSAQFETITPDRARDLLSRNVANRPVRRRRVAEYVRQLKAGEWEMNGETIKISKSNTLLDGQHRLLAIIESGVPAECLMVYQLSDSAYKTIDRGLARTAGDDLSLVGEEYPQALSIAMKWQWRYEAGRMSFAANMVPTKDAIDLLPRHPDIRVSVGIIEHYSHGRKLIVPKSMLAWLHYQFAMRDPDLTDIFVESLVTGENLRNDDPVYLLRERLIASSATRGIKSLNQHDTAALVVRAWNSMIGKKKIGRLLLPKEGYGFPRIEPELANDGYNRLKEQLDSSIREMQSAKMEMVHDLQRQRRKKKVDLAAEAV